MTTVLIDGDADQNGNNLELSVPTTSQGVGRPFTFTIATKNGNAIVNNWFPVLAFSTTDANGVVPGNYTFVAGDNGLHDFQATFSAAGTYSITATDTVSGATVTQNFTVSDVYTIEVSGPDNPEPGVATQYQARLLKNGQTALDADWSPVLTVAVDNATVPDPYQMAEENAGVYAFNITITGTATRTLIVTADATPNGPSVNGGKYLCIVWSFDVIGPSNGQPNNAITYTVVLKYNGAPYNAVPPFVSGVQASVGQLNDFAVVNGSCQATLTVLFDAVGTYSIDVSGTLSGVGIYIGPNPTGSKSVLIATNPPSLSLASFGNVALNTQFQLAIVARNGNGGVDFTNNNTVTLTDVNGTMNGGAAFTATLVSGQALVTLNLTQAGIITVSDGTLTVQGDFSNL